MTTKKICISALALSGVLGTEALVVQAQPKLEEIVVTGELLDRRLEQTLSSVAVIDGEAIKNSAVTDIYDVIRATANAGLEDSDYGYGGMTLRGIGSYGSSGSGAYASYGTTSVVVLDGVGLPRSALSYADLSAFDLASVEIFRGPQSTSQGRNAMAGAVVINTVEPALGEDWQAAIQGRLSGGNQGYQQTAVAANLVLWPETLSLRLTHDQRQIDGDIHNPTRDKDDWGGSDGKSTRLLIKWQPGGADGEYTVLLGVSEIERYQGSRYVSQSREAQRQALVDAPVDYDSQSRLVSLDQHWQFGERWALRAISAYVESDTLSRFDSDYTAQPSGATVQRERARDLSQELRLSYLGEAVQAMIGAYYYDGVNDDTSEGFLSINGALETAGMCGVEIVCGVPLGNILFDSGQPTDVQDMAVFAELDWSLTSRLTLTTGVRVDREKNSRVVQTYTSGDSPSAELAVTLLRGAGAVPEDGDFAVAREFSEVLPKIGLRYALADDWYLGAVYSEGYRPGGDGYNQVSGRYFQFDAEKTKNAELSLKGQHLPWHLYAALNVFHTRWEDMQVQGGEGVDNFIENAGLASIQGAELELRWQPFQRLGVAASMGVIDGEFDEFVNLQGEDLSGNGLPKAPEYSGSLALEWRPLSSLMIRPSVEWAGATPSLPDNRPEHELPAYELLNLSLRWELGALTVFAYGSNLTDEHYRKDANAYNSAGVNVASLGDARRWWGGVEFAF